MNKRYATIPSTQLTEDCTFAHPPELPAVVHLDDHALDVMTDFRVKEAYTISPTASLTEAAMEMKVCNTHMLFVVNSTKEIIGMITTEDLLGEKPLKAAMSRQIKRSEVIVRMVMIQHDNIATLDINDMKFAKVGNLVETLHELKQHYALVVETHSETNAQEVRGLFSLWDLSSRAGTNLTYDLSEAHSLAELQRKIEG